MSLGSAIIILFNAGVFSFIVYVYSIIFYSTFFRKKTVIKPRQIYVTPVVGSCESSSMKDSVLKTGFKKEKLWPISNLSSLTGLWDECTSPTCWRCRAESCYIERQFAWSLRLGKYIRGTTTTNTLQSKPPVISYSQENDLQRTVFSLIRWVSKTLLNMSQVGAIRSREERW